MPLLGVSNHSTRHVDANRIDRCNHGKQITESTANLEHSGARRNQVRNQALKIRGVVRVAVGGPHLDISHLVYTLDPRAATLKLSCYEC
jgi:hypothetical protein